MIHYAKAAREILELGAVVEDSELHSIDQLERIDAIAEELKRSIKVHPIKGGWYINKDTIDLCKTCNDILNLKVTVSRCEPYESKELEETLYCPLEEIDSYKFEEHGGEYSGQQSILVSVEHWSGNGNPVKFADVQIEIDPRTGEFQEWSLAGWNVYTEDEEKE